ncbi:Protein tyrosine kinase [Carpediemonas membranifera]|uniref:Protein tyrosine kinase n=1 Tax=Carpediemonas membranifera TaxID=201153 RepID=A0A8J6B0J9_9EUKA|nr:Protein tyrosine kinase [Carpediemonas membranifera]|eukprot:KAG9390422.1 Protein tyrosine kinase [Carpediemonas membranifera]
MRVFTPEDKFQLLPLAESPLIVTDLARVLDNLSVRPREFSMRLTEPDLTVTMRLGRLVADKRDNAVDAMLAAWNARMNERIQTIEGHSRAVSSVAFLPDGTRVTGSWDGTIKLWDKRGVCKMTMKHGGHVWCIAVSPGGSTIASGGDDHNIKLWDQTGRLVKTLEGHFKDVRGLTFSPDGKKLVSGSSDRTVRSWDVATGKCRTMEGHSSEVFSVAISPDGKTIVSGSYDNTIKVWVAESGRLEQTLEDNTSSVYSVAISPDGALLASGSNDNAIRLWDTRTWECVAVLRGHTDYVNSVAFSPDSRTLASGSDSIKLWSVGSGKCLETLKGHTDFVFSVAFSPDGSTLLSGSKDKTAKQWSLSRSPELIALDQTLAQPVPAAAIVRLEGTVADLTRVLDNLLVRPREFSMRLTEPDLTVTMRLGRLVADKRDNAVDAMLAAWNARMNERIQTIEGHSRAVSSVAFLPDGTRVTGSWDGTIKLWDKRGVCKMTMKHGGHVWCIAVSPGGSTIASGGGDHKIKLWDQTGRLVKTLKKHANNVRGLAFSTDGKTLVSGSDDKTVRSWDVATGKCRTMEGHSNWVYSVAISPDGKTIVSGSYDNTIKVWDAESGRLEQTLEGHKDSVTTVAISPDGALLASGSYDDTIRLWDTRTWERVADLWWHASAVCCVAFSPDGKTLASGSYDNTAKLWNIGSRKCFKTLGGHDNRVNSVAFSPDGSTLLSGSDDQITKLWHIEHAPEIGEVCAQSTLGADIRLPSNDSPLKLTDLARVVIHIIATGLPRSFEMRLTHPPASVNMDEHGLYFEAPTNAEMRDLLAPLNQSRLNELVAQACADAGIALPAASTAVVDPSGFISVSPADCKVAEALIPFNRPHIDAAVARLCAKVVTSDTAISVTHADLPALKKLLAHVEAIGVAPRSFEVQLDDPAAAVTLGPTGFEVAPPSNVVRNVVSGFSFLTAHLDAISADNEISLGEHAPLTIDDLKTVVGLLLRRETLPTSFEMRLTRPECTISSDRNGFFQSSPETAEVQTALNPLNCAQLSRRLSEICAEPITEETDLCIAFGSHVPCFTSDMRRVLDHVTAGDVLPRSFAMAVHHPKTTVSLGPRGFTSTHANPEVNAILEQVNAQPSVVRRVKVHETERMLGDADDAMYSNANFDISKRLLAQAESLLGTINPHAEQHEPRVLALRTDLARLQPVQALAKDPMPALRGRVKEALDKSDELHAHIISGDVDKMHSKKLLRSGKFGPVVLNCLNREGQSPLHNAFVHDQPQAFATLLKAGCLLDDSFPDGHPLLAAVVKPPMLAAMLSAKVDIDTVSRNTTALVFAIQGGHWDSATKLLARGADPLLPPVGVNALQAVKGVADPLMTGVIRAAINDALTKLLNNAITQGDTAAVKRLLAAGVPANGVEGKMPPLFAAVKAGGFDIVSLLLKHGADQTATYKGKTAAQTVKKGSNLQYLLMHDQTPEPLVQPDLNADITKPAGSIAFSQADRIGEGGMAAVFRGTYSGSECAVKVVEQCDLNAMQADRLQNEIHVHKQLRHNNVIALYALEQDDREIRLALELASGSLSALLLSKVDLPWDARLKFARDIAAAMAFIAGEGYEHRDLKSLNVLVSKGSAKISDFGLTARLGDHVNFVEGSWPWMAPERFDGVGGEKADVYAFGITLWEIAARDIPYRQERLGLDAIRAHVRAGYRPRIPAGTPAAVGELIRRCVALDPHDRPTFTEVIATLPDSVSTEMYTESAVRNHEVDTLANASAPGMMTLGEGLPAIIGTVGQTFGNASAPWMTLSEDERAAALAAMGTVTATYRTNAPSAPGLRTLNDMYR